MLHILRNNFHSRIGFSSSSFNIKDQKNMDVLGLSRWQCVEDRRFYAKLGLQLLFERSASSEEVAGILLMVGILRNLVSLTQVELKHSRAPVIDRLSLPLDFQGLCEWPLFALTITVIVFPPEAIGLRFTSFNSLCSHNNGIFDYPLFYCFLNLKLKEIQYGFLVFDKTRIKSLNQNSPLFMSNHWLLARALVHDTKNSSEKESTSLW